MTKKVFVSLLVLLAVLSVTSMASQEERRRLRVKQSYLTQNTNEIIKKWFEDRENPPPRIPCSEPTIYYGYSRSKKFFLKTFLCFRRLPCCRCKNLDLWEIENN